MYGSSDTSCDAHSSDVLTLYVWLCLGIGLATLVGMVGPTTTYLGGDSAVHLAEELKDASYILPRAMVFAALANYALGFATTVSFMFNLGDLEEDLNHPSGQPWVAVIRRITGSQAATIVLLIVMIIIYLFCAVNQVTTSSRQIFAFARDKGLPFHGFLSKVRPQSGVPANSVYVTLAFTCCLALIIIGVRYLRIIWQSAPLIKQKVHGRLQHHPIGLRYWSFYLVHYMH